MVRTHTWSVVCVGMAGEDRAPGSEDKTLNKPQEAGLWILPLFMADFREKIS